MTLRFLQISTLLCSSQQHNVSPTPLLSSLLTCLSITDYMDVVPAPNNHHWYTRYHWNTNWSWGTSTTITTLQRWVLKQERRHISVQPRHHSVILQNRRKRSFSLQHSLILSTYCLWTDMKIQINLHFNMISSFSLQETTLSNRVTTINSFWRLEYFANLFFFTF